MKSKTYCFVAGVSGGHILPALNLAHDYQKEDPRTRIIFITTDGALDTNIMRDATARTRAMRHQPSALSHVVQAPAVCLPITRYMV